MEKSPGLSPGEGMQKLAVLSSDTELNDRITLICEKFNNYFEPHFFNDPGPAIEFLKYELPEINILNFSDNKIDHREVLNTIKEDPWLHYGGIILVHKGKDRREINEVTRSLNVVATMTRSEFVKSFFRVLKILVQNRQILFQRDLQKYLMKSISGSLTMDNDPFNVGTYANLIPNYLYNIGYIDVDLKDKLHVALFEMLMNAVEHGNCNISYNEKSAWLEEHGDIIELIRKKNTDERVKSRRVYFSYTINPERSRYTIRDEGEGFDWRSYLASKQNEMALHGRGIMMTGVYTENLSYNEMGNEVSFEVAHNQVQTNMVPAIFQDQDETVFRDDEVVFREGEASNYMYYIVSGQLNIYRDETMVSRLTSDDLFLGEMSFLLSNTRSATVRANGEARLIRISKNDFVNSIKAQPHYGILLARLLAGRLDRLNDYVAKLKARVDMHEQQTSDEVIKNVGDLTGLSS
jgi:CRP-like cAMP-binding protein/anti-sigma regulatory factor (Ser/Thr protein kinase)